jgi:hypothetical protein
MREGTLLPLVLILACTAVAAEPPADSGPPSSLPPPGAAAPANGGPAALPPSLPGQGPTLGAPDGWPADFSGHFMDRCWFTADYLLWWNKDNHLPPLLSTGSTLDTHPGALGQSGTQILYGGAIDSEERSGGRFSAGCWFTEDHFLGLDASFFFLAQRSAPFSASSNGTPLLTEPFFDVFSGQAVAFGLATPGSRAATYTANVANRFWGTDTNLRTALLQDDFLQWTVLAGFRYLDLSEALDTHSAVLSVSSPPGARTVVIETSQHFGTRNYFYGGQLGSEFTSVFGQLSVALSGKVALGATHEIADISGGSLVNNSKGGQIAIPVSELIYPSNAGRYSRDIFTVVPELGVNFGYDVTSWLRLTMGYTFLYMTNAIRPGDLIDTTLNVTQARAAAGLGQSSGPLRPAFSGNASDFWAHGLNVGLALHY